MLLAVGSFAIQALLLLVFTLAEAQHYDADYHISEDEDSAGYTNEHNSPDYSKYFNSASSAPQQEENSESGFVTPLDFPSFFGSPQTGFSSGNIEEEVSQVKQGDAFVPDDLKLGFSDGPSFGSVDYFEQAQKETTKNEETSEEKPGYISSNLPGGYQENIENFRKRSEKYRPFPTKKTEEEERQSYTNFKPSPVDLAPTQPPNNKKYTQTPASPYSSYSFQSQKSPSYSPIPYNPSYLKYASPADSSYEYIPSQTATTQSLKRIGCLKMNKKVPSDQFNKAPMTCYVCKDPKSGVQSEHCSYEQEPNPKSFYKSSSQTYGQKPETYRIKREDSKSYDPYEEVKAKSHRYSSQPEEFAGRYYKAPDFSEFERYSAGVDKSDEEEEDEKSYSEKLSEELVKQKDNCKKIHKDGISCLVCENAETGGNYEQCSYQSEPNEKKYAYVRESKYDADKDKESSPESESERSTESEREHDDDNVPIHFAESTDKLRRAGVVGLDPKLYGRPDSRKQSRVLNQESKQTEAKVKPEPYYDPTGKRDVDKVLEEFSKKDRSNCEQIKKKGMTCYLCIDKKGIKHEECMYISESRPQSSLVAYHEKEILKNTPNITEAESRLKLVVYPRNAADTEAQSTNQKEKKKKKKQQTEPEPKPEFDVNDKGGLYSDETKPVYVKSLGMILPKYMVEKTDYERDFDKSTSIGR